MKICGITDELTLRAAVDAGADAVGFVLAESSRRISLELARVLCDITPQTVATVAVVGQAAAEQLDQFIDFVRPKFLQADAESFVGFDMDFGCHPLPVHRRRPDEMPPLMVLEGARSGVGEQASWPLAAELSTSTRLVLAGGLDPTNVRQAILETRPFAVDVSSGVEQTRGIKDPDLIGEFVRAVRDAEAELPDRAEISCFEPTLVDQSKGTHR